MQPSITNLDNTVTKIPQLRISVTVPCGKKCVYCRPGGEGFEAPRSAELTPGQFAELAEMFVRSGVRDIKLTGGDPMLRKDIVDIVRLIKNIDGVRSLHLVTRHHRAGEIAPELKAAGLDVLNFSIDSLDGHTWSAITGVKGHQRLIDAVYRAAESGITIKLNSVIMAGVNSDEIPALAEFAGDFNASLKLLDLIDDLPGFPASVAPEGYARDRALDLDSWIPVFASQAVDSDIDFQPGGLGHPMPRFRLPNGATILIKSSNEGAWYGGICEGCALFPCHDALMAVRLTADGKLQYCLLREDNLVDLRSMVQRGDVTGAEAAVAEAVRMYSQARFFNREELSQLRARRSRIPLPLTVV
jgi:cyclic pyranopterin phosphate synthase